MLHSPFGRLFVVIRRPQNVRAIRAAVWPRAQTSGIINLAAAKPLKACCYSRSFGCSCCCVGARSQLARQRSRLWSALLCHELVFPRRPLDKGARGQLNSAGWRDNNNATRTMEWNINSTRHNGNVVSFVVVFIGSPWPPEEAANNNNKEEEKEEQEGRRDHKRQLAQSVHIFPTH